MIIFFIAFPIVAVLTLSPSFFNRFIKTQPKRFYVENRFKPVNKESTHIIYHNSTLFSKLENHCFAQIGSNPKHLTNTSYSWFDGDGMIHGVYFEKGQITYQNKWIQTKRLNVEDRIGKKVYLYLAEFIDKNGLFKFMIYSLKRYLHIIPGVKGTANTALLETNNRFFALHEGDLPYELEIKTNPFNISTKGIVDIPDTFSTTAHPIKDDKRDQLYMCSYNNYNFKDGKFIFNVFNKDLVKIQDKNISLLNNGIVHSTSFTGNKLIIPDMPMKFNPLRIFTNRLPLYFDKHNGVTRFGILDVDDPTNIEWYHFDENFYVFHFSDSYETPDEYIIYACVIRNINIEAFIFFEKNDPTNKGNGLIRKIRLNKKTKRGTVIRNKQIEDMDVDFCYNTDFPITSKLNTKDIYCCIFDSNKASISGYLKINTDDFRISKPAIFLLENNTYGTAEPQTVVIENKEYLLGYLEKDSKYFISLIDVLNQSIESIEIPARIPPGFHSMFCKV